MAFTLADRPSWLPFYWFELLTNLAIEANDTPFIVDGGLIARSARARANDRINIKDDSLGDGTPASPAITSWLARLNASYTHGTNPNVAAAARSGYVPSGIWKGAQDILSTGGFGYSLFGDGRVSQLQDIDVQVLHNGVTAGNFAIIGSGATPTGTGLDIRGVTFFGYGINIYNKDIAVENSKAADIGGFGSNNTLIGGWLRGGRIGVSSANNDLRVAFMRGSDFTEAGFDRWDGGGIHFIGNNIDTDFGPSIRWRGKSYSFTGNTIATENVITSVSDFSQIQVGDVIGSLALGGTFPPNARIESIDEPNSTVTIDLPASLTETPATITVNQIPVEDFYVDNTFNSRRQDDLEFEIVSITDASGNIRVTLAEEYYGLSLGDDGLRIQGSSVPAYNLNTTPSSQIILAIEDWKTIVLSIPYVADATGGTLLANNFDAEVLSQSPTTNALVRDQFFVGNNINRTLMQGGADFNFIGTRLKTSLWMDGVRPFRGETTIGSDVVTVDPTLFDTAELREGLPLTFFPANFPTGTIVEEVLSTSTFRVSNDATASTVPPATVLIRSPYTPNNIFHIPVIDTDTINQTGVTIPSGPGGTVGWGQVGLFPNTLNSYVASEGSYLVGMRAPYTAGGMVNGEVAHLNELGVMNTGIRFRTNTVEHNLQGSVWRLGTNELTLQEDDVNVGGLPGTTLGADVSFNVRAYRSTSGSIVGNAIQRFEAPRNTTSSGETSVMGYIVAPGNDTNDLGSLFLGASGTGAPTLTGDAASIRALAANIEITSNNKLSGWKAGTEWFRLSGDVAVNGSSFIAEDVNNIKRLQIVNGNAGTLATAAVTATQAPNTTAAVNMQVYGTGFTPVGSHDLADGGAVYSGAGLSAGLTLAALAGNLRLNAAGEIILDVPTSDPGVPNAIWCDTGAARVLKLSA